MRFTVGNMNPRYLEWDTFAICAVAGVSGSGKTSTTRFILAQLAMNNIGLIVGDQHGELSRNNLASTIGALENAFILPIARNHAEIMKSIKYVNTLMEERIAGNGDTRRVALVIDEVAAFFMRCTREELTLIANMFLKLANEARKFDIRVFLLSQSWKSDFIGSRSIRSSITHVIFHRLAEDEIKLFYPSMPANTRRAISQLKTGNVYFYPDGVKLQVPYITQDDLTNLKIPQIVWNDTGKNNQFLGDLLCDQVRDSSRDQPRDRTPMPEKTIEPKITQQEIIKQIIAGIRSGETKEQTILRVLKIRKGGKSQKWLISSRLYDTVKERVQVKG